MCPGLVPVTELPHLDRPKIIVFDPPAGQVSVRHHVSCVPDCPCLDAMAILVIAPHQALVTQAEFMDGIRHRAADEPEGVADGDVLPLHLCRWTDNERFVLAAAIVPPGVRAIRTDGKR